MSGRGNCYDNAAVETFFKTLKTELIWRRNWETRRPAVLALFQYINGFYNPRRRHLVLAGKAQCPSRKWPHERAQKPASLRYKAKQTRRRHVAQSPKRAQDGFEAEGDMAGDVLEKDPFGAAFGAIAVGRGQRPAARRVFDESWGGYGVRKACRQLA